MKPSKIRETLFKGLNSSICALALAGILLSPVNPAHGADSPAVTSKANKQVEKNTQDKTAGMRKEIASEAVSALSETRDALKALDDGKKDDALSALERATGKLEIILARDPKLALAPTGVSSVTYDIFSSPDAIKDARREALDLMQEGRVQDARLILKNLASENVISVTNIPLATYPEAIKLAVKELDDGKIKEAKDVLQTALNTLVVTQTIIPLHVVRAQQLLKEAESLAENKDRKSYDNTRLSDLLNASRHEIEMAEDLGYGTKKDFKIFYDELAQIEAKTADGKSGAGFFEKIKAAMTAMVDVDSQKPDKREKTTALKLNN